MKNNFYNIIVIVVIIISILTRFLLIKSHFTHVDDIGVANTIINAKVKSNNLDVKEIKTKILDKNNSNYSSFHSKILRSAHNNGLLDETYKVLRVLQPFLVIPYTWTYAPAQYFITTFFINSQKSYNHNLFWGRFISFSFSIIAIFLFYLVLKSIFHENIIRIISLMILSFSFEFIIYSVHMASYAVGVLSLVLLLYLLVNSKLVYRNVLLNFLFGCLIGFLCWAQYQLIVFLPGFFISSFNKNNTSNFKFKRVLKMYIPQIIGCVFLLLALYFIFLRFRINMGAYETHWSSGENLEYLYSVKGLSFYEGFIYTLRFFYFNFIDVLYAVTGFYYIENYGFKLILFTIIISLMILGLINLCKTKNSTLLSFFLFIIIGFVGWIVMVLIQKFPLSPTRHSLILLPILVILITSGIGYLLKKTNINSYFKILLIPFIFSVFLINYPAFYKNRISSYSEEKISNLIDRYNVDTLFLLDYTIAPILMHKLELPIYYYGNWINERYIHKNQNKICFLSHRSNIEINRAIKTYNNAIFFDHDNSKKLSNESLSLLYSKEITSNVEMEFGNMVKDATNSFYLYIYEIKF